MTWIPDKRAGALAFAVIAALVVGGLGWVTWTALVLEEAQAEARVEAEQSDKLRLALWRLDSRLSTDVANTLSRPYAFISGKNIRLERDQPGKNALRVLLLNPAPGVERPPWVLDHFLVTSTANWNSDQAFERAAEQGLGLLPTKKTAQAADDLVLDVARAGVLHQLLARTHQQRAPAVTLPALGRKGADDKLDKEPPPQAAQYGFDRDATLRLNQAQMARSASANSLGEMNNAKAPKQTAAVFGPLLPLWVNVATQQQLVVARLVELADRQACEAAVLNWPTLQKSLADDVSDLLPNIRFLPVPDGMDPSPAHSLAQLPVELHAGSAEAGAVHGWTALRIGLALAWVAALVALAAVGLGGLSLLELAERRARFISAVTHELRTPLTTLRLYLDLLASGMVRDESKREEYLHTLNAEAERLSGLIGNVLDFSGLEKGRPRLEKTLVRVSELLEPMRCVWEGRCRQVQKDLVIDEEGADGVEFVTDARLVHQILGNLIENACKYSKGASDPRIWVRVRHRGRQVVIEVEDKGQGVAAQERTSIFRPFRRGNTDDLSASGVGLGLALAHSWARLLDGRLTLADTKEGAGACFRLELPLSGGRGGQK